MKKFINLSYFLLSMFFSQNLMAEDFQLIYDYGTFNKAGGKNTLRIDNDTIIEIDNYKFASGIDLPPDFIKGVRSFYLVDCKNKKIVIDQPKLTKDWYNKNSSIKPSWENVSGKKTEVIFDHICNFSNF